MSVYVQQQLEYGGLWKLLEFSQRVDKLLEVGRGFNLGFKLFFLLLGAGDL